MTVLSPEHNRIVISEGERRSAIAGKDVEAIWQSGFGGIFNQPVFWWFDQFYVRGNTLTLLAAGTRLEIAKTDLLFAERKLISFKLQLARIGATYSERDGVILFELGEKTIEFQSEIWEGYAVARSMTIKTEDPSIGF